MQVVMGISILRLAYFFAIIPFTHADLPNGIPKYNDILIVVVDDLRHLPDTDNTLLTPIFSTLARKGVNFNNAFAQQALCAPSRNSMLTGRRPDTLRLYDFYSYWRDCVANFTTLPQLFKERGYYTYSIGKVFHPGLSSNYTDDYPYSWSEPPFHPFTDKYKDSAVCADNNTGLHANLVCPVDLKKQPGSTLPDIETVQRAIDILKKKRNKPLLLAVGFHKPHIPLKFPQQYLDLYPLDTIATARQPFRPFDMPQVAWHPWIDVRKRHDIRELNIPFPFGVMPELWSRKIKQSYFSCVSFIDHLLGQLIAHVDMEKTVIVLTSDHGWSLGENGLWAKYSNFDVNLKVPLILHIPGTEPVTINQPVELIDLFPTLVELSGLEVNIPKCSKTSNQLTCFEGKSLVPLIKHTKESNYSSHLKKSINQAEMDLIALSQYPRPSVYPQRNTDKPRLKDIKIMGYSLRTERFRYTEWVEYNNSAFSKNWNNIYGAELYDHSIDAYESLNLYKRPGMEHIVEKFSALLKKSFHSEY